VLGSESYAAISPQMDNLKTIAKIQNKIFKVLFLMESNFAYLERFDSMYWYLD